MKIMLSLAVASACGAGYYAAAPTTHFAPNPTALTIPHAQAAANLPASEPSPRECKVDSGADTTCSFN